MSRYRTIKPDYWTSEQVVECSPIARLLFIGIWNFCDDGGVHPDSAKKLKMEIFPADDITVDDIREMVTELVSAELLQRFEEEGKQYLWVTGWHHQKIDRPSFRYPSPSGQRRPDDSSSNARRALALERRGKERNKTLGRNSKNRLPSDWEDRFEECRDAYPSRGKATNPVKPAKEKFGRLIRDGTDPLVIIAGTKGYASAMADLGYAGTDRVKQMLTFLNQAVWEQYQPKTSGANGSDPPRTWQLAHKQAAYEGQFPGCEAHQDVAGEIMVLVRAGNIDGADKRGAEYLERGVP